MSRLLPATCLVLVASAATARGDQPADDVPPQPLWVQAVSATSVLADKHDAYAAWRTLLPKATIVPKTGETLLASAWCEGKPDEGLGEGVTIAFPRPTSIDKLTIKAGVWMTQALFDANNTITGLDVITDDGRTISLKPPPRREEVVATIGGKPVSEVMVKITAVKKGRMNDSCLSEIAINEPGTTVALGFDATAVAKYPAAVRAIVNGLWPGGEPTCDATALAPYLDLPLTVISIQNTHSSDPEKRFVRRPRVVKTAAAFQKACGLDPLGMQLAHATVNSSAPSVIDLGLEMADYSQTLELAWRAGTWHLAKIH